MNLKSYLIKTITITFLAFNLIYLNSSIISELGFVNLKDLNQFLKSDLQINKKYYSYFIDIILFDSIENYKEKLLARRDNDFKKKFNDNILYDLSNSIPETSYYGQKSTSNDFKNIFVIGDLHGNYQYLYLIINDLIDKKHLTTELELKPNTKIICTGDYIDRGPNSIQILMLLMILKLTNPDNVILLKGNHENIEMVKRYGFYNEIEEYYKDKDTKILSLFDTFFKLLPIVHYEKHNNQYLMFNHAGYYFDDIIESFLKSDNMHIDLSHTKKIRSLIWNDIFQDIEEYYFNSERGIGYIQPASDIIKRMKSNNILAKFGGHMHQAPNFFYNENGILGENKNNYKHSNGFINIGTSNNPIYIIISATIKYNDNHSIKYNPSYLKIRKIKENLEVKGYFYDKINKKFKNNPVKRLVNPNKNKENDFYINEKSCNYGYPNETFELNLESESSSESDFDPFESDSPWEEYQGTESESE